VGRPLEDLLTSRLSFQFKDELGIEIREVGKWMVEFSRS